MIRVRKCLILFSVLVFLSSIGQAQPSDSLPSWEAGLEDLFGQVSSAGNNVEKENLCDSISGLFDTLLKRPASFHFPFDSLRTLGKVYSPDGKLRFYTWNLAYGDGTNRFYGMLQFLPGEDADPLVYRLNDGGEDAADILHAVLDAGHWDGSLVYEIAQAETMDTTFYIVLGYAPLNLFVSEKTIDVLYFKEGTGADPDVMQPVFGRPFFQVGDDLQCRVVFIYSAQAQMTLHWNDRAEMIVFDHLSPVNPSYTGNYQFYGPDFSYDGYVFSNGFWRLVEDIDIRNIPE